MDRFDLSRTFLCLSMIRPNLDQVKGIATTGRYSVVPVSTEILCDFKTPMEVLKVLKNISGHCYMLESVAGQEKWGVLHFTEI